jgi:predicted MFS family arabinose efflux permease
MLSSVITASSVGRVIGALVGGAVWLAGGLTATSLASAALSGLALACLVWGLSGWRAEPRGGGGTGH